MVKQRGLPTGGSPRSSSPLDPPPPGPDDAARPPYGISKDKRGAIGAQGAAGNEPFACRFLPAAREGEGRAFDRLRPNGGPRMLRTVAGNKYYVPEFPHGRGK